MYRFSRHQRFVTITLFGAFLPILVYSQRVPDAKRSATIERHSKILAIKLSMVQASVSSNPALQASVSVSNLSNTTITFPAELQVHIENAQGEEPPTTLLQRQRSHTLRAGEHELSGSGFEPDIPSGGSFTKRIALVKLYDLKKPGTYRVYVEALDESSSKANAGVWVRSDSVTFNIGYMP